MAQWTKRRLFQTLARWIGWTAVFTVAISVWGASAFMPTPLLMLGEGGFVASMFGLVVLAFGIGVRFSNWSWLIGVIVASVLQFFILTSVVESTPERAYGAFLLPFLPFFNLLLMLPAGAGVWWGQRRKAGDA